MKITHDIQRNTDFDGKFYCINTAEIFNNEMIGKPKSKLTNLENLLEIHLNHNLIDNCIKNTKHKTEFLNY